MFIINGLLYVISSAVEMMIRPSSHLSMIPVDTF